MSLPCEIIKVPASKLNDKLQALRAKDRGIPVLLGDDTELERVIENHALQDTGFETILAEAKRVDVEAWFKAREEDWAHADERSAKRMVNMADKHRESFTDDYGQQSIEDFRRRLKDHDFEVRQRAEIIGAWPERFAPTPDLLAGPAGLLGGLLDLGPRQPEQHIALVPVETEFQALAFLKFGGWNECPLPHEQVAVAQYWSLKYDLKLYQASADTLQFMVARPPNDKTGALTLAWQQFFFCEDLVYQGMDKVRPLAASLLNGQSWYFWWD